MRRLAVMAAVLKGVLMTGVVLVVGTTFLQSLVLVAVSATITGSFMLVATALQHRLAARLDDRLRRLEQRAHDTAAALGVTQREHDDPGG